LLTTTTIREEALWRFRRWITQWGNKVCCKHVPLLYERWLLRCGESWNSAEKCNGFNQTDCATFVPNVEG